MVELYNGDCLDVMKTIKDHSVDLILCDLPYVTTACKWDNVIPFEPLWEQYDRVIKENGNIVLFSKQPFTTKLNSSNLEKFRYELIWEKQQATSPMLSKQRILPIHENISVFYKSLGTYNPQKSFGHKNYKSFKSESKLIGEVYGESKSYHNECTDGSRFPTSILRFNNVRKAVHPTQKPVPLLEYLIKTYTNENDLVLDNCMGSGSTGVACKNTNRNFIGIELDKNYFEIAKNRIENTVVNAEIKENLEEW